MTQQKVGLWSAEPTATGSRAGTMAHSTGLAAITMAHSTASLANRGLGTDGIGAIGHPDVGVAIRFIGSKAAFVLSAVVAMLRAGMPAVA